MASDARTDKRPQSAPQPGMAGAMAVAAAVVVATIAAVLMQVQPVWLQPWLPSAAEYTPPARLFTADELRLHDGRDPAKPLLLAVLGEVFDVTKGERHYRPGQPYAFFTGRDGSRAFTTGDFTEASLTDDLAGLSSNQVKDVARWRERYRKDYMPVGHLVGRYFGPEGQPTVAWHAVEAQLAAADALAAEVAEETRQFPACNSRWAQNAGGEVWCDADSTNGAPRYPRRMFSALQHQTRCTCVGADALAAADNVSKFSLYDGCGADAVRCRIAP